MTLSSRPVSRPFHTGATLVGLARIEQRAHFVSDVAAGAVIGNLSARAVLLRHRTIPMEMLQGSLAGQTPVPPAIAAQSDRMQNTADFWQALGGRPKAALNYTVTIAFAPQESVQGPVVVEKVINMNQI